MILKQAIKPKNISFLQNKNALYAFDFRAISESMDYEIPAMWKYENLLPWILDKKSVAVNESCLSLKYPNANDFLKVTKSEDPKISIFERLSRKNILANINCLWVAIPHPDADKFAKKHNLKLNYSYSDFLVRNNKLSQKELFGNLTPKWHIISSKDEIENIANKNKQGFIKREYGSGGYAVFDVNKAMQDKDFLNLFGESDEKWYFEEFITGKLYSIQCLIDSNNNDIIIFGFSEQKILDNKYFAGSKILPLDYLRDDILIQLQDGIKLAKPLLKNYIGFFGVDFIVDKENKISILEANIRTTAATIPTLLTNTTGGVQSEFEEDFPKKNIKNGDIILSEDLIDNCVDVLRFCANKKEIGKSFFLDFKECAYMPTDIDNEHIKILSSHIENSVSDIVGSVAKNFWPFGWTVCFILEESHCVISGWYLEKRVLVDVFSCNTKIESVKLQNLLVKFFMPKSTANIQESIR